jgi:AmiR/NasT family two-component response regulator
MLLTEGGDRLVVHQATGMVAIQLDVSTVDALASLRAAAYRAGRSIYEVAVDVVNRRLTFRD